MKAQSIKMAGHHIELSEHELEVISMMSLKLGFGNRRFCQIGNNLVSVTYSITGRANGNYDAYDGEYERVYINVVKRDLSKFHTILFSLRHTTEYPPSGMIATLYKEIITEIILEAGKLSVVIGREWFGKRFYRNSDGIDTYSTSDCTSDRLEMATTVFDLPPEFS
ncbi:MAG: hypothetical protein Q7S72_00065 [Candidatus Taylorbacteria bacterium]|nr:hypothetical protein [Candidatus Taylorbacteria bacterium]